MASFPRKSQQALEDVKKKIFGKALRNKRAREAWRGISMRKIFFQGKVVCSKAFSRRERRKLGGTRRERTKKGDLLSSGKPFSRAER